MNDSSITPKQKLVLATFRDLKAKHGKSPTLKELRLALGYAGISSVQRHVDALKKKGYLQSDPYKSRSLQAPFPKESVNIPLIGNVAAGMPILAQENVEAFVPYDGSKIGDPKNYFFLRAVGDSMDKAGIDDGDFVLIKSQPTAEIGERVVVLIGDEATIKKFEKGSGHYVMQPESTNPANKPIYMFEEFSIQGVIVDVLKKGGRKSGEL